MSPSPMLFLNLHIPLLLRVSSQQGASKQQKDGSDAKALKIESFSFRKIAEWVSKQQN